MKVAVCYSGMLRNLLNNFDSHEKHLLSKYDCDIFLDLWDVHGFGTYEKKYDSFDSDRITEDQKIKIIETIKPKFYNFEEFDSMGVIFESKEKMIAPNKGDIPPYLKNVYSMFYKMKKCGESVAKTNINYDVIIKTRCDLVYKEDIELQKPKENTIYVNERDGWGLDAIGDRFLYGNSDTMKILYSVYDNAENLWLNKISILSAPEHVLYTHLKENNLYIEKKPIWMELNREKTFI